MSIMYKPSLFRNSLIVIALLLGIYFRFEDLEKKLIWHDEIGTRMFSAGQNIEEWQSTLYTGELISVQDVREIHKKNPKGISRVIASLIHDDPQHPPLYYILAGIWTHTFGDQIGTLRLLSALLSLFCFPAIYWLCKELYSQSSYAWTGVALIASSPFFVLYAQEGREYALWFALILFSNASLLQAIRLTDENLIPIKITRAWIIFSIFTALALYTSLATVSMMIGQVLYIMFRERLRITRVSIIAIAAYLFTSLLFLPWAIALVSRWEAFEISMAWSKVIHIPVISLLEINALNISRTSIDFWPDRLKGGFLTPIGIGLATALAFGSILFLFFRSSLKTSGLVLALIAVPLLMLLGPDLLFGGIRSVSARYIAPSLMGIELALAFLLSTKISKHARIVDCTLLVVLGIRLASCFHNSSEQVVWTKGISYHLPGVAKFINESNSSLVIGNRERHHPGNLLALSHLLKEETKMQFLTPAMTENPDYRLPEKHTVFLFSPVEQFRQALEKREKVHARLLTQDLHLDLWIIEKIE
jgi:uncharacterized membrane protein